jgi:GntR family transcriptional regulator
MTLSLIEFRLDDSSGRPTYLQLVYQVRQAIRLGRLRPEDQLPSVRDVVSKLAINPNTVLKAYRELEQEGLVTSRHGSGTFVRSDVRIARASAQSGLRKTLARWLTSAREAGQDEEDIRALFEDLLRTGVEDARAASS